MDDKIKQHLLKHPKLDEICNSVSLKAYTDLLLPEYEKIAFLAQDVDTPDEIIENFGNFTYRKNLIN
jgi:hypothetical protein